MIYAKEILVVVISYSVGCICMGYYLVRLRTGKDIRLFHSGSTGARNVGRLLGPGGFAFTLGADFAKGVLVSTLATMLRLEEWAVMLAIIAAVIGHIFPVQLAFRGGKGVAVMLGAIVVFDFRLALAILVVFVAVFALTRKYIVSGMLAMATLPVTAVVLRYSIAEALGVVGLTVIILFAHRANIRSVIRRHHPKVDTLSSSDK